MGAWPHVELRLGLGGPMRMQLEYIGRPRRSSPSEGYSGSHKLEQERLITEAMITSKALREGALASVTRDPAT